MAGLAGSALWAAGPDPPAGQCVVENRDKIEPAVYRILGAFARG
jgi:hypothetical protein